MTKPGAGFGERMDDFNFEVVSNSKQKSGNLQKMIRRKELLREDPDGNEEMADAILEEVLQNGGLTTEEVYAVIAN